MDEYSFATDHRPSSKGARLKKRNRKRRTSDELSRKKRSINSHQEDHPSESDRLEKNLVYRMKKYGRLNRDGLSIQDHNEHSDHSRVLDDHLNVRGIDQNYHQEAGSEQVKYVRPVPARSRLLFAPTNQPSFTVEPLEALSTERQIEYIVIAIGLPLACTLLLSLLLYYLWSYCKKMLRFRREQKHKSKVTKLKSQAKNSLASIKIIGSDRHKRHKKTLDKRQLTIGMESNEISSDDQYFSSGKARAKYTSSLDSQAKFVSADQRKDDKCLGSLKFALSYNFERSLLSVSILEAQNLPPMDLCGTSDPYVKVYLSSDNSNQQANSTPFKTKIHKRTLNPVFNETFQFNVDYPNLSKQTLNLLVIDYDRLSKHDEIGCVSLDLSSLDLTRPHEEQWHELQRRARFTNDGQLGDICLSLRYVPTAGKLTVVVLEARKLKKMDVAGLSDPYVKLALTNEFGKRLKKKKTSIKKCTLNPHYNESFSFEIPFEQVQKVQLHVSVIDYDRIGTSEPIGRIILGYDKTTGDTETRHWMDMLASPRRPIAQWHCLKQLTSECSASSSPSSMGSYGADSAVNLHQTANQ